MKETNQTVTSVKLTPEQIAAIKHDLGIKNDKHVPTTLVVSSIAQEVAKNLAFHASSHIHAVAVR